MTLRSYSIQQIASTLKQMPFYIMRQNWAIPHGYLALPGLLIRDLNEYHRLKIWDLVYPKYKSTIIPEQVIEIVTKHEKLFSSHESMKASKLSSHEWHFTELPTNSPYYSPKTSIPMKVACHISGINQIFNATYINLVRKFHPGTQTTMVYNRRIKSYVAVFQNTANRTIAVVAPFSSVE